MRGRMGFLMLTVALVAGSSGKAAVLHVAMRDAMCAPTAEAAVAKYLAAPRADSAPVTDDTGGFRVTGARVDVLTAQQWWRVASCDQPAAMERLIAVDGGHRARTNSHGASTTPERVLVIHAGDEVRVLSADAESSVELRGVAMSAAASGEAVDVRLARWSADESGPVNAIRCEVLSARSVRWLH